MKALVLPSSGALPVLAEAPMPAVGDHEILIRVEATSVNPVDDMVASGFFEPVQEYRFPAVLGRDVAGVVEHVGDAVTRFQPGQSVWGFVKRAHVGNGTFAEYVACPAEYFVTETPPGTTATEAGVLGLAGITAQECLDALDLPAGDTVFVNGAAGGAGCFAVQLAVARGLTVIATARPGRQQDFVLGLGASAVVDWTSPRMVDAVREHVSGGVDGMVDFVRHGRSSRAGTDESASARIFAELVLAVVTPGGPCATTTNAADPALLGDHPAANVHSSPTPEALGRLADLVGSGAVLAPVQRVFDLDDIDEAFTTMRSGVTGKIAVRVAGA